MARKKIKRLEPDKQKQLLRYIDIYCTWHGLSRHKLSHMVFGTGSLCPQASNGTITVDRANKLMAAMGVDETKINMRIKVIDKILRPLCA